MKKKKKFLKKKINNYDNDYIYDDAPEEFLDPITFSLMEDPVTLPSSKITVERKIIEDFILNVHKDPFNRKPLTKEELIPNIELKKRIDEYKLKKMKDLKNNSEKYKDDGNNKIIIDNNNQEKPIENNNCKQDNITTKERGENEEEKKQNE